ncbi:MAG: lipoate--protein ligase [Bacteroidetes bacterium]|nr:MAG: lipoate--protein ligase [Bacteroidota bacterium]
MLFVENDSLDPYFNIAAEEYLLKNFESDVIMLWRSNPSVIVGKHQNTLAEINLGFVRKNNIPVIRRLTGGGTVFHDPGNINFTFIKQAEKEKLVDFKAHTAPVIDFLNNIGVDARFEGKNDLRVNGLKISGNAEHIFKNKVLHHGTLLFDANLQTLSESIKSREPNFTSKAVKSVRSTVVNIASLPGVSMGREEFMEKLGTYLQGYFKNINTYQFNDDDRRNVEKLKQEKYTQWIWNYGYSPQYTFKNSASILNRNILVELTVKKGIIENLRLCIDLINQDNNPLVQALNGQAHNPETVESALSNQNFMGYNQIADKWLLTGLFF